MKIEIELPENATNGDMIKAIFNPYKICEYEYSVHVYMTEEDFWKADFQMNYDTSWWDAPYSNSIIRELKTASEDCISRQAVLKIYDEWFSSCNIADKKESPKAQIKALPPVTPQQNTEAFDKLRAEIIQIPTISFNANDIYKADVLQIIDKYRESETEK